MMSVKTIIAFADEVGAEARRLGTEPLVATAQDVKRWRGQRTDHDGQVIPNIGSYRPKGWDLIDDLFCDKTGLGSPDGPALNRDQVCDRIEDLLEDLHEPGLAIIEEGESQLVVGVFRRNTAPHGQGRYT